MRVLKIELEGVTTSFRYPHFMIGRQPSYTLPPPSTIYGHVASALGLEDWLDPASFSFGYTFTCAGWGDDLESVHFAEVKSGWIDKAAGIPRNLEATINPLPRQILLNPRLTLYLETADLESWKAAFREPRYPVLLGRSQDLASYRSVEVVELVESDSGYYEGTLLPNSYRQYTNAGVLTNMPLFINPLNRRQVDWAMFLTLEGKLKISHDPADRTKVKDIYQPPLDNRVWIDPDSPAYSDKQPELRRVVVWHTLIKE